MFLRNPKISPAVKNNACIRLIKDLDEQGYNIDLNAPNPIHEEWVCFFFLDEQSAKKFIGQFNLGDLLSEEGENWRITDNNTQVNLRKDEFDLNVMSSSLEGDQKAIKELLCQLREMQTIAPGLASICDQFEQALVAQPQGEEKGSLSRDSIFDALIKTVNFTTSYYEGSFKKAGPLKDLQKTLNDLGFDSTDLSEELLRQKQLSLLQRKKDADVQHLYNAFYNENKNKDGLDRALGSIYNVLKACTKGAAAKKCAIDDLDFVLTLCRPAPSQQIKEAARPVLYKYKAKFALERLKAMGFREILNLHDAIKNKLFPNDSFNAIDPESSAYQVLLSTTELFELCNQLDQRNLTEAKKQEKARQYIDSYESMLLTTPMSNKLQRAALAVCAAAAAFFIGFAIGAAAGAWTGPAAIFTGLAAGLYAAIGVVAGSAVVGVATYATLRHTLFAAPFEDQVKPVIKELRELTM